MFLLLAAGPAQALHRDSGNAGRITRGVPHSHPSTRSWGHNLAFTSPEDLDSSGSTGQQIWVFNLFAFDCFRHSTTETTCPAVPEPYLTVATDGPGNPDNPTVDSSGTLIAFDADGSFNGGTGPAVGHRQIFIKNLQTGAITAVTSGLASAGLGDSVKPSFNSPTSNGIATTLVFESRAPLKGGKGGTAQVFLYRNITINGLSSPIPGVATGNLVQVTNGDGDSTAGMTTADGSKFVFQSRANLSGATGPDGSSDGPDTGVTQLYWYDKQAGALHKITNGQGSSQHAYLSEKEGFVFFDSFAADPGSASGGVVARAQIWTIDITPPNNTTASFVQITNGPGESTWPTVPRPLDRVAFVSTGDLLDNEPSCDDDCSRRLFVRHLDVSSGNVTLGTLRQITARGEVFPPIAAHLGQWFLSLSTSDDMSGDGICAPQLHMVDYFNNPVHYPSSTTVGQKPFEPAAGNPDGGCEDENGCTTDTCNAGTCSHTTKQDGDSCEATTCLKAGTCQTGHCIAESQCDDMSGCTLDSCDPTLGCTHTQVQNCQPCTTLADCDDSNPCTLDTCVNGGCAHDAAAKSGQDCSTPCRLGDTCDANGACLATGTPKCPADSDICTLDLCDAVTGTCSHPLDSGCRPCTPATAATDCADGNVCTTKACIALKCEPTPVTTGTPCSNGNPCDGSETCDENGICAGGTPPTCTPPDACHTGTCDPDPLYNGSGHCRFDAIGGCKSCTTILDCPASGSACIGVSCTNGACAYAAVPNNTPCSDGNACNGIERCQAGTCTAGNAPSCDDKITCTIDSCDPVSGCTHTPVNAVCDDGQTCTTEVCSPTQGCVSTPHPDACDDHDPCTDETCTAGIGCGHVPRPNGSRCGLGDGCTNFPICSNGVCVGDTEGDGTCNDRDECTTDVCTSRGCQSTELPGFDGIECRLSQLEAAMSAPPVRRGLAAYVAAAGRRIVLAEGHVGPRAVPHLRIAERRLRQFAYAVVQGGAKVPRARGAELARLARVVIKPVSALRAQYAAQHAAHQP